MLPGIRLGLGHISLLRCALSLAMAAFTGVFAGCSRPTVFGSAASLAVGNTSIAFDTTGVENTIATTVTIENSGQTAGKNLAITGWASPFAFLGGTFPGVGGTCAATLGRKSSCTLVVSFTPTVAGLATESVTLSYNSGLSSKSFSLDLSGTAVAQGLIDSSFGTSGLTTIDLGYNEEVKEILLPVSGKILLAGNVTNGTGATRNISLSQLNSDGSVDSTFGSAGTVSNDSGSNAEDVVEGAILTSDGKVVIAGAADTNILLARYTGSALDTTFGSGMGFSVVGALSLLSTDHAYDLTEQTGGKFIVIGETIPLVGNSSAFAMRFTAAGAIDSVGAPIFGTAGIRYIDFTGGTHDRASTVALQPDGQIVVAGYTIVGGQRQSAIARLASTNGAFDVSFNGTGMRVLDMCGTNTDDEIRDVAVQSDSKIIVTGYCSPGANKDMFVSRFNTNGSLDTTFGGAATGVVTVAVGGSHDEAYKIAVLSSGKLLAAGYSNDGAKEVFALVRLKSDGTMDNAFGAAGMVTQAVGTGDSRALALAIEAASSKSLISGYATNANRDFAIGRFFP